MNSATSKFLDKYRELEKLAKLKYDCESPIYEMERDPEYGKYRSKISYCRSVRNILSHNPKVGEAFAVEVSEAMIKLLEELIEDISKTADSIMIKSKYVLSCRIDDNIMPAMRTMSEKCYTHIPILENGVLKGVFSENTLLSYIIDDNIIEIDDNTKFSDLEKYLSITAHRGESFRFISENTSVTKLAEIFRVAMQKQERVGMVFVTKTGKSNEKIKGIITAWDLSIL